MSRICGIVDFSGPRTSVLRELREMLSILQHTSAFETVAHDCGQAAIGRVHYGAGSNFSSSSIALTPFHHCVSAGYITDPHTWTEQILEASHGEITARTPADIIAFTLQREGPGGLVRLNGVFAFALWNEQKHTLHLGVDRLGMKPLYYIKNSRRIKFSSEIKALKLTESHLSINNRALADLAVMSFVSDDMTHLDQVHRVPMGTVLTFGETSDRRERFWWFDQLKVDTSISARDYVELSQQALQTSIARLAPLCKQPLCTLSSGADSRRIFLELVQAGIPLRAYTATIPLKGGAWECDSVVARELCRRAAVPHTVIDWYDPSIEDRLARGAATLLDYETDQHRWTLPMLRKISLNAGVNFDGFCGDIFVYNNIVKEAHLRPEAADADLAKFLLSYNYGVNEREYLNENGCDSVFARLVELLGELPAASDKNTLWYAWQWARRRTSVFSTLLTSLKMETVYPYLDNDLVELSMSLRPELKIDRFYQHELLEQQYPELMKQIPTSKYPNISTEPDDFCRPFVQRIPKHFREVRTRTVRAAAARSILEHHQIRSMVPPGVVFSARLVRAFDTLGYIPARVMAATWRLTPMNLISEIVRTENRPDLFDEELRAAREFVYSE